jgi:integron integrase
MVEESAARYQEKHHIRPQFVPTRSSLVGERSVLVRQPFHRGAATGSVSERPRPRLLDQVREAIRTRHYSLRTEESYVRWIKRFIFFHGKRHPAEMGEQEITQFLSDLAVQRHVSASTQNQALSALLFLYREVLSQELYWLQDIIRAKRPARLPTVLSRDEVKALLKALPGEKWLMATLLYGAGLRLMECLRLRVKDVDFARNQILVREGKGNKDRVTMLPAAVKEPLARHLKHVREQYESD